MMWASISSIAHAWWVVILEICKNCSLTSNAFTGGSHEYDIPILHDSYDLSESTQVHGGFAVVVHLQLYETYAGLKGSNLHAQTPCSPAVRYNDLYSIARFC